jgi:flagellar basal-body rod protein FlgF
MDRMIYLSMSGAKATMQRQDVLANNLANASTTGFRAELQAFRAVPVRGDGASTRVYALETTTGYDPAAGPAQQTGRPLDVALQGNAWLAVQGFDGTEAYTRMGSLQVDAEGTLMTSGGRTVLGDGGPIQLPPDSMPQIAADGTVTVRQPNGSLTPVGRLKLVTPEAPLARGDDGLFRAAEGDLPADPNARLQDGALEGSNVNPIENLVAMIAAARPFVAQM